MKNHPSDDFFNTLSKIFLGTGSDLFELQTILSRVCDMKRLSSQDISKIQSLDFAQQTIVDCGRLLQKLPSLNYNDSEEIYKLVDSTIRQRKIRDMLHYKTDPTQNDTIHSGQEWHPLEIWK